jgi:hypothetical protein
MSDKYLAIAVNIATGNVKNELADLQVAAMNLPEKIAALELAMNQGMNINSEAFYPLVRQLEAVHDSIIRYNELRRVQRDTTQRSVRVGD